MLGLIYCEGTLAPFAEAEDREKTIKERLECPGHACKAEHNGKRLTSFKGGHLYFSKFTLISLWQAHNWSGVEAETTI